MFPRGTNARNDNTRNANAIPPILNHEAMNVEFGNRDLTFGSNYEEQSTCLVPANSNSGSATARV